MPASLDRLDQLIADTEVAITEQVFHIIAAEAEGRGTKMPQRVLRTLYGLLIEYRRARDATAEAQRLVKSQPDRSRGPST